MNKLNEGNALSPYLTERRVALEKRRLVSEMSVEEMRQELLTSQVTGLPNRRAFDEAGASPAVAMADMDGLKALNNYGYDVGNAILWAMAGILRQVGLQAFHDKGDEFLCRGFDSENLTSKLESARSLLRDHRVVIKRADGSTLDVTGADFSYGVGKDLDEAEAELRRHKTERERAGNLARAELRAITISRHKHKTKDLSAGFHDSPRIAVPVINLHDDSDNNLYCVTSVIL